MSFGVADSGNIRNGQPQLASKVKYVGNISALGFPCEQTGQNCSPLSLSPCSLAFESEQGKRK